MQHLCSLSSQHPKQLRFIFFIPFHAPVVIQMLRREIRDGGDGRPRKIGAVLDQSMGRILDYRVRAAFPYQSPEEPLDQKGRRRRFLRGVPRHLLVDPKTGRRQSTALDATAPQNMRRHLDRRCFPVRAGNAYNRETARGKPVKQRRQQCASIMIA